MDSNHEKLRIVVLSPNIYICSPTRDGNSFEKVGQFDDWVREWCVDASGILWVYLHRKGLARLTMVRESSSTLQNCENESAI